MRGQLLKAMCLILPLLSSTLNRGKYPLLLSQHCSNRAINGQPAHLFKRGLGYHRQARQINRHSTQFAVASVVNYPVHNTAIRQSANEHRLSGGCYTIQFV